MLQELQEITNITKDNELEVVRTMVSVLKQLDERTSKISDWGGSQDMSLMNVLVNVGKEQKQTNQKLGKVETQLGSLEETVHTGFQELSGRFDNLEETMGSGLHELSGRFDKLETSLTKKMDEQTELLRMIAHNTRHD